ncbi:hypothetical protein ABZZ20_29985 [Streptomyces sp. NPDC006430]|uniref:hypothetical protein n=1 Tax=Streptomyces sp. NPDC006430 TaxID=3154299 RepID=UPI0033B08E1F
MLPVQDRESVPAAVSHTPIYDALYSEYLRSFRTLPGDRTGEEDLGFTAFSYGGAYMGGGSPYGSGGGSSYGTGGSEYGGGSYGSGWNGSAWQTDPWPASYAPPPQAPQPAYAYAYAGTAAAGSGDHGGSDYANGRQYQTGMHHIPAALPPAPRRGY